MYPSRTQHNETKSWLDTFYVIQPAIGCSPHGLHRTQHTYIHTWKFM